MAQGKLAAIMPPTIVIVAFIIVHCFRIEEPFVHHRETGMTQYAKHAWNFNKFGFGKSGGLLLDVSGRDLSAYDDYRKWVYSDHPPLPSVLISFSFSIFGKNEAAVRVVTILFAASSIALFALFIRMLGLAGWSAILAVVAFAFAPMYLYFSVTVPHLPTTLFFTLAALCFYLRFNETAKPRDFALFLLMQFFACYCDWPGYYTAIPVAAHLFFVKRRRLLALVPLVFACFTFGIYILHNYLVDPENLAPIKRLLATGGKRSIQDVNWMAYPQTEAREVLLYFGPALIIAAIGLFVIRKKIAVTTAIPPGFLLFLALDEIVFYNICEAHDYYSFNMTVFFGCAAGIVGGHLITTGGAGKIIAASGLVALLAQSAWVVHRRFTDVGAFEYYFKLADAVNRNTAEGERIAIIGDTLENYVPFYADRFTLRYSPGQDGMLTIDWGLMRNSSYAEFRDLARKLGIRKVFISTEELVRANISWLKTGDVSIFSAYPENSARFKELFGGLKKIGDCNGFLICEANY